MEKNSKEKLLIFSIVAILIIAWISIYLYGLVDDKLPDPVKGSRIKTEIKKVVSKDKGLTDKVVENNFLSTGIWGGLEKVASTPDGSSKNKDKTDNSKNNKKNKDEKFIQDPNYPVVVFETNKGNFEVVLYKKEMPITAGNFERLVKKHFYDGIRFHRIINNFMIQAGDPLTKDLSKKNLWGRGGPGYRIRDEFVKDPKLTNKKYTIAMANAGPNTGGSQFFINLKDNQFLDFDKPPFTSKHPVFGKVINGFNVVDKIERSKNGEVVIKKIYLK